jgi:hypothetical protein
MATSPTRFLQPEIVAQLDTMELRARMIVEGFITGLHKSPYHGFSVEFAEHRPYNPGDELRHVDWKVYAKTDRHYVKQYEEETNLRHYVVLDTSASMQYRHTAGLTKLRYSAHLAAALHYLMVRQRDATGLIAFDESVHTIMPPRATGGYLRTLLAKLESLTAEQPTGRKTNGAPRTGAAAALHEVAERIARRSLVVVLTDLFENIAAHDDLLKAPSPTRTSTGPWTSAAGSTAARSWPSRSTRPPPSSPRPSARSASSPRRAWPGRGCWRRSSGGGPDPPAPSAPTSTPCPSRRPRGWTSPARPPA